MHSALADSPVCSPNRAEQEAVVWQRLPGRGFDETASHQWKRRWLAMGLLLRSVWRANRPIQLQASSQERKEEARSRLLVRHLSFDIRHSRLGGPLRSTPAR